MTAKHLGQEVVRKMNKMGLFVIIFVSYFKLTIVFCLFFSLPFSYPITLYYFFSPALFFTPLFISAEVCTRKEFTNNYSDVKMTRLM